MKFVERANVLEQFLKWLGGVAYLCCQLQHSVYNQIKHLQKGIPYHIKQIKGYIKGYQNTSKKYFEGSQLQLLQWTYWQ